MQTSESGYIAAQFLFVLLFISAIACGAGMIVSEIIRCEKKSQDYSLQKERCDQIIAKILVDLCSDPTPTSDTADDPVWKWNNMVVDGGVVSIRSLSSSINPNFIRKDMLEHTDLKNLLLEGKAPADLQQFRYDNGLKLSGLSYSFFFDSKTYLKYFSTYGWANINLVDEFALEKYIESITGSKEKAKEIHDKVLNSMIEQKTYSASTLKDFLATDYESLYPYINAEPSLNINFADPYIIKQIIGYPGYGVKSPAVRAGNLIAMQGSGIRSSSEITNILGIDTDNPLYYWFGCITWFWQISISNQKTTYITVICRMPDNNAMKSASATFRIIEQGYE